ncbi:MAG TPA: DUF362 domain-containing protein [Vicinamibacterales bacterium]|nr:DUF362 domain-containing protein [Vicinamibacterales bacterium]
MHRRSFVRLLAAATYAKTSFAHASAAAATGNSAAEAVQKTQDLPALRVVSSYTPAANPGMPGPYPGRVVAVNSARSVDTATGKADEAVVREMMAQGMRALAGAGTTADAWRRFFEPSDVVGIKVNCGGYPHCISAYEIVGEVVRQLTGVGVPVSQIYVYERFQNQMDECDYTAHLPKGVQSVAAERANQNVDTSRMMKIINIPNMKDHGATGVTGCLKNIAYGSFSNVARTHSRGKSHTYSVVGSLAAMEPLRSRTVLQIMDGLRGVWHGGPFARTTRYVFYPRQIMFATDPVAVDRLLLDIIENERRAHGAISIWDRSPASLKIDNNRARDADPNVNIIIREPGHVEYAATLGLGVYDIKKIKLDQLTV